MKINIVSKELIKPSTPTPIQNADYNLSFLDEPTPHFYIPLVLYYHNHMTQTNQSEILTRLKTALSHTLTRFYPLAGRNKGQTLVRCNDEGVCFVVARVDGLLKEMVELPPEGDEELEKLVPYGRGNGGGIVAKTEELLAVQVSLFRCGGVAIGVCVSHRVADVCSLCAFLKGWAACTCGDQNKIEMVSPVFNGSSIFPARGTPDFKPQEDCSALHPPPQSLATTRFVFTASAINQMKTNAPTRASRVEVVSALLWKRCTAAKEEEKQRRAASANVFPVNIRRRMDPPLPEYSFGNLYQTVTAVADGAEEEDWPCLVKKLREASERIDSSYLAKLAGENGFRVLKENFGEFVRLMARGENVVVFRFTSWCGFGLYDEMDFGWGNPVWVSTPGFGSIDTVILLDSRDHGGVEAWVTMDDQEMTRLEQDKELQALISLN